jgi:hypothetical protein
MMMPVRSLPFLCAAPIAAQIVAAQAPAVDVRSLLQEPARRAWDAAKQLAAASDYSGALVEFTRAYALSQNPRVLYNVGITEKLLTHYARAADAWSKELADGAQQLSPAEQQELKNAIAIVQQFVTTIDVSASEPDGTLDGRDVGPAPFQGEVSADKHTIEARAPGYVTVGETVDVAYKQPVSLVLTLSAERHQGRLHVVAPEGASIAVDEHAVGSGAWEGVVSTTGGHQIVVHKPGYQTYASEVYVADDQLREVNVPLNREENNSWVAWGIGSLLVVTGGIVAGYFIFRPTDASPYVGDLTNEPPTRISKPTGFHVHPT